MRNIVDGALFERMERHALQLLGQQGGYIDDAEQEKTLRDALLYGRCVEIDIPEAGGSCTVRDVGVTYEGRIRFVRGGKYDDKLQERFEEPIYEWISKQRWF